MRRKGEADMRFLGLQNCEVEGLGLYEAILSELRVQFDCFHAYRGDPLPPAAGYDAIFIGGTPISAYALEKHPFLVAEAEYIRSAIRTGKPCLGICFGAQLIATVLGADVGKSRKKEIGVYELELTPAGKADPLLQSFPRRFPAFQWHGDTFDIPAGAELLITGADCRNQMFRCGKAVGVQFHLEIAPGEAAAWAQAYPDELGQFGKTSQELFSEMQAHEQQMAGLARQFLTNLIGSIQAKQVGG
jgi:GMP synthase (glutamine-hydrolysing)